LLDPVKNTMLSRVANTLYWMLRYVERADNLARLIDVNEQLLLDWERLDSERLRDFWMPIVWSAGDDALYSELYGSGHSADVIRFLTDDRRNPNSIVSCIFQARENARTVRDQLSDELWEELNSLYLFLNSADAERILRDDPPKYYGLIRRSVFTFQGIASSTIDRGLGWDFMDLGRHLERADKTTRFLDISTFLPPTAPMAMHWNAIVKSCGAMGAYRAMHAGMIEPRKVCELLIFSRSFPRSVRYCMGRVQRSLHSISGSLMGDYSDDAERITGRVMGQLNYGVVDEFFKQGLHEALDRLQTQFNRIGEEVFESYVLMPHVISTANPSKQTTTTMRAWQYQQEQEQQ
jgi:uncharacterized alpha-E superfamily protein